MGIEVSDEDLLEIVKRIKETREEGTEIDDRVFRDIVEKVIKGKKEVF